ncbi:hypothetical protein FNV43_RR26657 [Rhamnella rubrinervis]|uniref:Uncharacterized protein n=1 Tax=Rhamnella rubrinervis TaxID=2594499 RepID=A0A8K0GNZ4_9ROSA|nr:hypothetical protein FNV43_RR26657 [Rhamnella rubrinervis]
MSAWNPPREGWGDRGGERDSGSQDGAGGNAMERINLAYQCWKANLETYDLSSCLGISTSKPKDTDICSPQTQALLADRRRAYAPVIPPSWEQLDAWMPPASTAALPRALAPPSPAMRQFEASPYLWQARTPPAMKGRLDSGASGTYTRAPARGKSEGSKAHRARAPPPEDPRAGGPRCPGGHPEGESLLLIFRGGADHRTGFPTP